MNGEYYEAWLRSARKWISAFEKTIARERFRYGIGFKYLRIVGPCGYCNYHEVDKKTVCSNCVLFKTMVDDRSVCYGGEKEFTLDKLSYFWLYIEEMRRNNPDFEKATRYCRIITETILNDSPDKKQAEEDGIDFSILAI
jgi:hypothetical protein